MTSVERLRRDLARVGRPVDRSELRILVPSAVAIVVVAQLVEPGTTADLLLLGLGGVVMTALVWLPRIAPELVAAGVVAPVSLAIGHQGHLELGLFLLAMLTLYTAWHLGSSIRAALIAGGSALVILALSVTDPDRFAWPPWVAAVLYTFLLGRTLRRQGRLIEELEAARTALAEQAVADERRRIARELHDLAGHTLAAVLLQVTGARHVLRRDPIEAERALVDAEALGRTSMDQIRATVAALRTSERGTDEALPEGDQLDQLITEYRRAGLSIADTIDAEAAAIDGPTGVALHRIVREALANVARHAPTNRIEVEVTVDRQLGEVRVRVCDRGRPPEAPDPAAGRHGLVGMGERARALGGSLVAEPTAEGWRVLASLPLVWSEPEAVDR